MLTWLNRVRAARMERFATMLRRRHAILQRPPTGQLILETVGISRRRLTLLNWAPRPEREAGPAPRRFLEPADAKSIRPSWPVARPPLPAIAAEPVPGPELEPAAQIDLDRSEHPVGEAETAAESLAGAAVDSARPPIEGEAPPLAPEPADLTTTVAGSEDGEPIALASTPEAQGIRAAPLPAPVAEPAEVPPIRSARPADQGVAPPDLPNVRPGTAAPPAETRRSAETGPAPEPVGAELRPAPAAGSIEPIPSAPLDPVAPMAGAWPEFAESTPAALAPGAFPLMEAGPRADQPEVQPVAAAATTSAPETPRAAPGPAHAGRPAEEVPLTRPLSVVPPVSVVPPHSVIPPLAPPSLIEARPERSIALPPEVAETAAPVAAAPSVPSSELVARSESARPAPEPAPEPRHPDTEPGHEPIAAQLSVATPVAAEPIASHPRPVEPSPVESSVVAPATREHLVAEPILAEPIVADQAADGEPSPAAVTPPEPIPADAARESRPPSWTAVETRQARPPARRREPAPQPSTADADPFATVNPFNAPPGPEEPATAMEWLARLQRAHGPKPGPEAPARAHPPARVAPQGQPISMANRELLEPMMGIDLEPVRVHQGADAARAAGALRADALAVGEQIVLGAGRQESDPKTVGLLGHELLHIARQRTPRFVPPILRGTPRTTEPGRPPFRPSAGSVPPRVPGQRGPGVVHAAEEEAMALVVEAAAIAASHDRIRGVTRPPDAPTALPPAGAAQGPSGGEPRVPSATPADPETPPPWGTLPAPWEPMPDQPMSPAGPGVESRAAGPTAPAATAGPWGVTATPPVQAAGQDRHVPEHAPAPAGPAAPGGPAAKVDLDALAKQVYTVLKRRLAGERRRAL